MLEGSGILRTKCEAMPLDVIKGKLADYTLDKLFIDMYQTMIAEKGIGLAANQIGHALRIFILKDPRRPQGYMEYINPEVLSQEELVDFENEGCLSIPGTSATTERFKKLKLRWLDRSGTTHEEAFEDLNAFAVQHEMDHIDGKLYIDQLGPVKRSMVLRKHKKFLREQRS